MLEDRDYMRQPEFGERQWLPQFHWRWSWTMILLACYLAVFIAQQTQAYFFPQNNFFAYLALSREGLEHGYVWQLLTYQFMHAGWLHLLLNCWAIFVFGSEMEYLLGGRRFLSLAFASGIVGGIFQVLVAVIWPAHFGGGVVGASACAFGLVAAFATIFPERELTMLIFFIIPVRMRARTLLILSAAVAVVLMIFPIMNIANAAHLGGMAAGWFYVRKILKNPMLIGAPAEREFRPPKKVISKATAVPDEDLDSDVDAILDKISARGIQSLTTREREILERARARMVKR